MDYAHRLVPVPALRCTNTQPYDCCYGCCNSYSNSNGYS